MHMIRTKTKPEPVPRNYTPERGLSGREAERSRELYGSNRITKQKPPGFTRQFFRNLNDPIIRILIGALVLNILFLFPDIDWYECGGIAFAVFVSTFVSTVSEYSSGRAFASLYAKSGETNFEVLRDGRYVRVPLCDIVCRDVMRDWIGVGGLCRVKDRGESRMISRF